MSQPASGMGGRGSVITRGMSTYLIDDRLEIFSLLPIIPPDGSGEANWFGSQGSGVARTVSDGAVADQPPLVEQAFCSAARDFPGFRRVIGRRANTPDSCVLRRPLPARERRPRSRSVGRPRAARIEWQRGHVLSSGGIEQPGAGTIAPGGRGCSSNTSAFAVHADRDAVPLQGAGEVITGELTSLVGIEDLGPTVAGKRFLERVDTPVAPSRGRGLKLVLGEPGA